LIVFLEFGAFRTANEAGTAPEMRLSAYITENAADVAGIADGEWAIIAPYGRFLSPDGSYVQDFQRTDAEKVVQTWNSMTGIAARRFKNLWHGLGFRSGAPVFDGHPDADAKRWPKTKVLAEVLDVRAGGGGLEGRVTWNAAGAERRTRGPLYPSALWWHWPPAGDPPSVHPEFLESVGLVPHPNIQGVPAWTANALDPLASPEAVPGDPGTGAPAPITTENTMDRKKIAVALGLAETATESEIDSRLQTLHTTANAGSALLATANAQVAALTNERNTAQTALTTANAQLQETSLKLDTMKTERDTLKTEKEGLTTANGALVEGMLTVVEKHGLITPAQREEYRGKLATANTAPATLTALADAKPQINVRRVEINGNRLDISTANARSEALNDLVSKRMKDHGEDRDTAFGKVIKDPANKGLMDAMAQPKAA
jgi:hypothetical protein